jgi:hypothetical protein
MADVNIFNFALEFLVFAPNPSHYCSYIVANHEALDSRKHIDNAWFYISGPITFILRLNWLPSGSIFCRLWRQIKLPIFNPFTLLTPLMPENDETR